MTDQNAAHFPISVKGVLINDGMIPLLKNERDEWELPGGKLELGEAFEETLRREVIEELGVSVEVMEPLNNWIYHVNNVHVAVITYRVEVVDIEFNPKVSHEHKELRLFRPEDIAVLKMPDEYKNSIALALQRQSHEFT
ncbi:MAG: NUDIX domain-containing protein [Acidihalobacter sp.]|uniref:NUDIX hydrolase n=1 Tax=Acidihalobacter sp. TaxID=1872108 RepID=UPI00307CE08C